MKLKKLITASVLTAAALMVFVLENQLPPLMLPGIKPGLANIFTLFAMEALGSGWAFGLLLTRILLGSAVTGQVSALIYGLSGGLAAYAGMLLLRRALRGDRLWVRSVFGAMLHNTAQLAAASAVLGTAAVWYDLPVLLPVGILTGSLTGVSAQLCLKRLRQAGLLPAEKEKEGVAKE